MMVSKVVWEEIIVSYCNMLSCCAGALDMVEVAQVAGCSLLRGGHELKDATSVLFPSSSCPAIVLRFVP